MAEGNGAGGFADIALPYRGAAADKDRDAAISAQPGQLFRKRLRLVRRVSVQNDRFAARSGRYAP